MLSMNGSSSDRSSHQLSLDLFISGEHSSPPNTSLPPMLQADQYSRGRSLSLI